MYKQVVRNTIVTFMSEWGNPQIVEHINLHISEEIHNLLNLLQTVSNNRITLSLSCSCSINNQNI